MMKEVQRVSADAKMGTLVGLFAAGRGVGAVLSGPISVEVLLSKTPPIRENEDGWGFGYGTEYGGLIFFTGASALSGLLCFGAKKRRGA